MTMANALVAFSWPAAPVNSVTGEAVVAGLAEVVERVPFFVEPDAMEVALGSGTTVTTERMRDDDGDEDSATAAA